MIECVFTLDYEIYGNGQGGLRGLVYEPAETLREVFVRHGVRFVNFVEAAEFERLEETRSDPAIDLVTAQIRSLHEAGFETGLHLHPQWYNATYEDGRWLLDDREYNLCTLPRPRIEEIVDRGLRYLRGVLGEPGFTPLSFRAGNWLFQPTQPAASVLAERGLRIDSSAFKGGVLTGHGIDYRPAMRNGSFWSFDRDVCRADSAGSLIEVPIHVRMVRPWKMSTSKRLALAGAAPRGRGTWRRRVARARDLARPWFPQKLDFCRMTLDELRVTLNELLSVDRADPDTWRPTVGIGHTKDLPEPETVERFLSYLEASHIKVSTFAEIWPRLEAALSRM
jgi:hypothetical protein